MMAVSELKHVGNYIKYCTISVRIWILIGKHWFNARTMQNLKTENDQQAKITYTI